MITWKEPSVGLPKKKKKKSHDGFVGDNWDKTKELCGNGEQTAGS